MNQDELVKFTIVRTSDAARKEVSISVASTKLMDLKRILAEDECFGPNEAPVRRQRIFHLGRELKSGGRSLCNLGLGRFNNRIIHLCIRPALDEKGGEEEDRSADGQQRDSIADIGARKRRRKEGASGGEEDDKTPLPLSASISSPFRQQNSVVGTIDLNDREDRINNAINTNSISFPGRTVSATSTNSYSVANANNNSAIDLLDSSDDDDDEVEIIEIL